MTATVRPAERPAEQRAPRRAPRRVQGGTPQRAPLTAGGSRPRRMLLWVATHAIAIALALMFLAPLAFMFLAAVMSDRQALDGSLWPHEWHWENFTEVMSGDMVRWTLNSVMYASLATVFGLVTSVPVAYALARFRFRGRKLALVLVVSMMMLPPQVTMVPLYIVWARLDLTGTLWPLILPNLFGDAFSIFLLRQFLVTIPRDYADAARVDGCGELRTMLQVVLPMAKPAVAAVALFQFFYCWNDYFGPLVYAHPENWPLAVGVASFRAAHHVEWNLTMAATLLAATPVIVMFFLAQRVFVQGVTLTGVKG